MKMNVENFAPFYDSGLLGLMLSLREMGGQSFVVGGAVRDALMGKDPKDFDVASSLSVHEVVEALRAAGWEVEEKGLRFVVAIVTHGDHQFEVAQFRNDGVYKDGKPVEVTRGDLNTDAARRDFTVNALYLEPFSGEVLDPTGRGLDDVRNEVLRFVGKPLARLKEDPMRALRFFRFWARGFMPHPHSKSAVFGAMDDFVLPSLLDNNAGNGVREELTKLVMASFRE